MQAYLTLGSEKHLRAAKNAFEMIRAQSFATGGWGPDESLRAPGTGELGASLSKTHNSFETPCGSYAHFKLTRYLMRVTRDPRYGDSMERVMYNTILGVKALQPDGRSFYYSDYNFAGKKTYHSGRWPCCSGTLPQVVSDYRINSYFRESTGVYVNLYIPSSVRWVQNGVQVSLTQKGSYPFDSQVAFDLAVSKPTEFTVSLRIPEWAQGAEFLVNGKRGTIPATPGTFAATTREWKTGDRLELNLPMPLRLEAVDREHPNTVALLAGPLCLFPVTDKPPAVTRVQLLAAKQIAQQKWQVETATGPLTLLPFTAIEQQQYTTYMAL
jgi:DUF1680 family protein